MAANDSSGVPNGAGSDGAAAQVSPLMEKVLAALGDLVAEHHQERGDDRIHVVREHMEKVALALRDQPELKFDMLLDVTAIDYLGQPDGFRLGPETWDRKDGLTRRFRQSRHRLVLPPRGPLARFAVVYHLFSTAFFHRLRIKCRVPEDDPVIPTVTGIWAGANWLERETYDMYGIRFSGHPDLRRIYLYDEFVGHPLRKDYGKHDEQPIQEFLGPGANYPRRPE